MTKIDQVRTRLDALQALIAALMADVAALEPDEPEPPVVDPPLPEEPVPVPEVPKGQRLRAIRLIDTNGWPIPVERISDILSADDTTLVGRNAADAAGRYATLAIEPPNGKPIPGTDITARFTANLDAPGQGAAMFLGFLQGDAAIEEFDIDITYQNGLPVYSVKTQVDSLPDPTRADNISIKWGFKTDVPAAKRYQAGALEVYVEHDGTGPTTPVEPEPSQPPSPPVDGQLIYAASPTSDAYSEKVASIDSWFQANIGGGFISDTSGLKGLSIAPAPDGKPALLLKLNAGDSSKQGFQIRRSLKGINAREATVSCDMWVPSKFRWRTKPGVKFLGLANGKSVGAGNTYAPDEQQGAYSRIVWWTPDDLGEMYFGLYYYSRNRKENPDKKTGKYWGAQHNSKVKVPRDRWFTIEHRLVLNDPGKANGLLSASLDGKVIIQLTGQDLQPSELGLRDSAHLYNESKGARSENGEIFWSNFRCVVK